MFWGSSVHQTLNLPEIAGQSQLSSLPSRPFQFRGRSRFWTSSETVRRFWTSSETVRRYLNLTSPNVNASSSIQNSSSPRLPHVSEEIHSVTQSRKLGVQTCTCMAESLHCPPETITTLLIGYIPVQHKKFKKKTGSPPSYLSLSYSPIPILHQVLSFLGSTISLKSVLLVQVIIISLPVNTTSSLGSLSLVLLCKRWTWVGPFPFLRASTSPSSTGSFPKSGASLLL